MKKKEGNARAEYTSEHSHLVGSNTGVAQPEDETIFKHRVEQESWQIQGTFLGRTDQGARCGFGLLRCGDREHIEWHGATVRRTIVIQHFELERRAMLYPLLDT